MAKIKAGDDIYSDKNDALEKVFNKKNVITIQKSNFKIKDNKFACFYNLSIEGEEGGWIHHKGKPDWLNILDCNKKAFTQINLKEETNSNNPLDGCECAVFFRLNDKYQFYGIFEQSVKPTDYPHRRICIFKRKSDELDIDEWQDNDIK